MFGDSNNKIGTREFASIVIYIIGIELSDATPTILIKEGKSAGWMLAVVGSIIAFISLTFLLKLLKRYENKGLMEIVYLLTGKVAGFVIGMIFFVIMLLFTAVNTRGYVDIISTIFFAQTPVIVLYVILIGSSLYIASKGFEAIGRVSYITQPYIITAIVIFILLILKQCNFAYLKPILGSGPKAILKGGITDSSIYGEIIIIAVLYDRVIGYKEYKLGSIIGLGLGTFYIAFFCMLYIAVYDFPPAIIANYLFQTSTRLIYVGRFVGNLEAFFFIFWLVASLVRYSAYLYMGTAYLAYTIRLKEVRPLLLPFAALTLILGMIPENYFQAVEIMRQSMLKYSWAYIYSMPIFLYLLSSIKHKKAKA